MRINGAVKEAPDEGALTVESFRREALAGLSRQKKTLPCKYLYDERGSRLFEVICDLEEYYPTRTELSILRKNVAEIAVWVGPRANLVDLGSGSGLKTRLLLENLDTPASCLCVDVAQTQLVENSTRLARDFPDLEVNPICADYTSDFRLPDPPPGSESTTVFFPGSTIGNFEPREAVLFLRRIGRLCGVTGGLLIGVDLKKEPSVLNPAYNDSRGVTADFNLNLLARANHELQAGFDLAQFRHHAFYNESAGRVEMHLISKRSQMVPVGGHRFAFGKGESIVTEHSYKYTLDEFRKLAAAAGLEVVRVWTDERCWFSVQYLRACENGTTRR